VVEVKHPELHDRTKSNASPSGDQTARPIGWGKECSSRTLPLATDTALSRDYRSFAYSTLTCLESSFFWYVVRALVVVPCNS
jgi:hypothetical protein